MVNEPPCAEPHAGWCGGWRLDTSGYPIYTFLTHRLLTLKANLTNNILTNGKIIKERKINNIPPPSIKPASVCFNGVTKITAKVKTNVIGPDNSVIKIVDILDNLAS
ncbi:hypothetical protein WNY51_04255 [Pseudocolwellia sp. AS88]|uniref:hypothetical protein n=1 Tax=Pseudocolwellia sp. AS88 TaxID=3063958 RepID=UPI0031826078